MPSRLPGVAFCLILACGAGLLCGGSGLAQAARPASKPKTDYRIFKIYHRYVLASRDAARSAQNDRINDVVLRYGNANRGLDHLKAKHGWGTDLDNAIQQIVQDPKTHVRAEGGGTYRWDDRQVYKGVLCSFRLIENRNSLSDGQEKGIITAYPLPPCGVTFILQRGEQHLSKDDLPLEADRKPLGFAETVDLLGQLEGTQVTVSVEPEGTAEDGHGVPSPVTLAGELHDAGEHVSAPVRTFSIGAPDEACGGRLRLSPSVFREANLSTFDGNDFFVVRILLNDDLRIVIQDEASGAA